MRLFCYFMFGIATLGVLICLSTGYYLQALTWLLNMGLFAVNIGRDVA